MRTRIAVALAAAACVLVAAAAAGPSDDSQHATSADNGAAPEMARAATNLWNALTPEQRKAAGFEFADDERLNFHFVPKPRKGLPWAQMSATQRLLAHALLASGLSRRGYLDTTTVMSLEEILAGIEQGKGPKRDPELYYFSVFGTPGEKGTWGWRVEGHHVSLNFTIVDAQGVATAPAFLGANPHEVKDGPRKGLRTLGAEADMGLAFVKSLDAGQRGKAILSDKAPGDIVTRNNRKAEPGAPAGIKFSELQPPQQAMLRTLVDYYAHRMRDDLAHSALARIDAAGWDAVHFAWSGGTEPGVGHYYRVQGPTFLIEYDNPQNGANHVHTVWRDLKNDFGEDLLKAHYEKEHK